MREAIKELLQQTIVYRYSLPNECLERTALSTEDDECFSVVSNESLSELIYNGIVEYALGEKHVDITNLQLCQRKAIKTRLRFEDDDSQETKIKYGFYGEVVLDLILQHAFSSSVLLAKGYFYNPLENSETKGYDAYQFYYAEGRLSLLLGEVKFYISFATAIKKILDNLAKAVSKRYFDKNMYALINEKGNFTSVPKEIASIIEKWEDDPDINLYDEVIKNEIKLYYPMLVLYDATKASFDDDIKNSVSIINAELNKRTIDIEMDIELFFIFIPVESAKIVKEGVIEWISKNEPLR